MNKITFDCEIITPMFIGSADKNKAELRAPSVKGALRFWWRAMNGNLSIAQLKEKEGKIFGSGSGIEDPIKSKVTIMVSDVFQKPFLIKFPWHPVNVKNFKINILDYLAYGVTEYVKGQGQVVIKEAYPEEIKFKIEIVFDNKLNEQLRKEVILAFHFLSYLGGMGAKSRNGFGRFKILNPHYSLDEIITKGLSFANSKVGWTAFSNETKIFQLEEIFFTWDDVLAELGKILKTTRESLDNKHDYNNRKFFASPITVKEGKKSINKAEFERYSKPLFLSVVKNNKSFVGLIILMPSEYLEGYNYYDEKFHRNIVSYRSTYNEVIRKITQFFSNNDKLEEITRGSYE